MARGVKKEIAYTGKAQKIHEEILGLEARLKTLKDELKVAHKEELARQKAEEKKAKDAATLAIKKDVDKKKKDLVKVLEATGKTMDEVISMLTNQD